MSVVLLLAYGANLVYTLVTHRDVFARRGQSRHRPRGVAPGMALGVLVLAAATAAVALEAELVSGALEATAGLAGPHARSSRA